MESQTRGRHTTLQPRTVEGQSELKVERTPARCVLLLLLPQLVLRSLLEAQGEQFQGQRQRDRAQGSLSVDGIDDSVTPVLDSKATQLAKEDVRGASGELAARVLQRSLRGVQAYQRFVS